MVDVLSTMSLSWSELQGKVRRLPSTPLLLSRRQGIINRHTFLWNSTCWVCSTCLFRTTRPSHYGPMRCPGPPAFGGILADPKGHKLVIASTSDSNVIVFCRCCFHYAAPHPRLLLKPCKGLPIQRKSFKGPFVASSERFYLLRHKHPVSKLRLFRPVPLHELN